MPVKTKKPKVISNKKTTKDELSKIVFENSLSVDLSTTTVKRDKNNSTNK